MLESLVRATPYSTDKLESGYLPFYDDLFGGLREHDVRLLELGVAKGGSLRLWRDFFPRGIIAGVDVNRSAMLEDPRIRVYQGSQEDTAFLDLVASEVAPGGFDVIIDDCSHIGSLTEVSFWHLFRRHLKPGGIYIIEDWGTGYWAKWPDGAAYRPRGPSRRSALFVRVPPRLKPLVASVMGSQHLRSHDAGMVGFVKRLVDECGRPDYAGGTPSAIAHLDVRTSLVTVHKA